MRDLLRPTIDECWRDYRTGRIPFHRAVSRLMRHYHLTATAACNILDHRQSPMERVAAGTWRMP